MNNALRHFRDTLHSNGLMPSEIISEGYSIRDCTEEMGKSQGAIQRLKRNSDEQ